MNKTKKENYKLIASYISLKVVITLMDHPGLEPETDRYKPIALAIAPMILICATIAAQFFN